MIRFCFYYSYFFPFIDFVVDASSFYNENKGNSTYLYNHNTIEKSQVHHKILTLDNLENDKQIITVHKRFVTSENKTIIIKNNIKYHRIVLILIFLLLSIGIAILYIQRCCKYKRTRSGR